ncbi:hypothetical protein HG536_0B05460 [Torulaspora globosa]|uniref:RRM domain-containing protein n=1 Tax=Torulaspora globosa TaxID=48254 RepID=A0A7G3ZDU5_9SACH|nr:uncharacterized protein HG536_0B05460 [Torulaspora globosa]QLL31681.1 hypothetical protein HG536_0B05460 [Torulaspora globosa]
MGDIDNVLSGREVDALGRSGEGKTAQTGSNDNSEQQPSFGTDEASSNEEDVIPTAIVIKNIPFAIKKEQLLDVIAKLDLPLPYAFNYHFDNGVFRGLAFANFTNTTETTQVLNSLNGREIGGRKIRVEYKKMLPQAERERIEREKREKRGQLEEQHKSLSNLSLHSLGKVSTTANMTSSSNSQLFATFLNESGNASANNSKNGMMNHSNLLQNQDFPVKAPYFTQQNVSQHQTGSVQQSQQSTRLAAAPNALSGERLFAPLPSSAGSPLPPQQLDFNDPDTLEIYSQLLLFKDRERFYYELAYPLGLSATHKRIINVLCSFLGLVEVYDPSFILIRRKLLDQATLQSHLQQQGQGSMLSSLQPNSTGGSMNRSHSYTSLLQAHAAASVAATANPNAVASPNPNNHNPTSSQNCSAATSKLPGQPPIPPQPIAQPQSQGTQLVSSPSQLMQPTALHNAESQQSQQQSFMRQQASLTPSSRIPSGYLTNNSQLNSVNPLLRNSNISPPNNNVQPNTAQHRVPPSFYSNATTSLQIPEQQSQQQQTNVQLLPQHTNGSLHSNFSIQSFHEDLPSSVNGQEVVYTSLGHAGFGNGLEEGLSRSLSGLDLQANASGALNNNLNARKALW